LGFAALEAPDAAAEAEREGEHPHAEALGDREVAELVDEDDDADGEDEGEDAGEEVEHVVSGHEGYRGRGSEAILAAAARRASASWSSAASSEPRRTGACASRTARMVSRMSGKRMRPSRNAVTATSLAALKAAGA